MKMQKLESLVAKLKLLEKRAKDEADTVVVVGFTQRYAIHVHENPEAHHPIGEYKYLEKPARSMGSEIGQIIATTYKKTKSLAKSLLVGGLRLQRAAQKLVPLDTGALKASAFTAFEKDLEQKAAAAFEKSEAVRKSKAA